MCLVKLWRLIIIFILYLDEVIGDNNLSWFDGYNFAIVFEPLASVYFILFVIILSNETQFRAARLLIIFNVFISANWLATSCLNAFLCDCVMFITWFRLYLWWYSYCFPFCCPVGNTLENLRLLEFLVNSHSFSIAIYFCMLIWRFNI